MSELKAGEVDRFLKNPDKFEARLFLVYGPDRGLVSERAELLAKSTGVDLSDTFSTIKLDANELASDPVRLIDEAYTVAMFGGDRLIRIRNAGNQKDVAANIEKILEGSAGRRETGRRSRRHLKKGTGLRAVVEKSPNGITPALLCRQCLGALNTLIDSDFFGIRPAPERSTPGATSRNISAAIGARRAASWRKLVALQPSARMKSPSTWRAPIASAMPLHISFDDVVDAVITGKLADFDDAMQAFIAAGSNPQPLLGGGDPAIPAARSAARGDGQKRPAGICRRCCG